MKKLLILITVAVSFTSAAQVEIDLFSEMNGILELEDGSTTNFWGYGFQGQGGVGVMTLPAPMLVVQQGEDVNVNMFNPSPEAHTIHWHGLDVDQANDGVPSTSFSIAPGEEATYSFNASHSGTYLYHCHVTTTLHLTMGMYGMFVVEYAENQLFEDGVTYEHEFYFLTSDLEIETNDNPTQAFPFHEIHPDYFMVNGKSGSQIELDDGAYTIGNDRVALRLGNMAYSKVVYTFPDELNAAVHMSDGRPLPSPFNVSELEIYPGERFSVVLSPSNDLSPTTIGVDYYDMLNDELVGMNTIPFGLITVGSVGEKSNLIKVFPNPTTNSISLEGLAADEIRIINSNGKVVYHETNAQSTQSIDVSFLPAGNYFVLTETGQRVGKFIKQ
ncbi:MAG: multicopper oxidase domain-containing protein [Flavobacteriales bacterium]|nr:multicopper oxidase domain-containing protein [Flavobacteriales bacterium]